LYSASVASKCRAIISRRDSRLYSPATYQKKPINKGKENKAGETKI
jgi:hypothetical protein